MIIRYYHSDQSGMPIELTNAGDGAEWRTSASAWGSARIENGSRGPHQPLRLQGQYFDAETGLHYNLHRHYDPDAGRFTSQDPIGLRGDINVYRYAPNPLGWADPLGMAPFCLNLLRPGAFRGFAEHHNTDMGGTLFTVQAYGSATGRVQAATGPTTHRTIGPGEMANSIRNSPDYQQGQTILLLACYAGRSRRGETPYAQRLARFLGEDVFAPTGKLLRYADGSCDVQNGAFELFRH